MLKRLWKSALPLFAASAVIAVPTLSSANDYPSRPIEMICTTKPGSGAAAWCDMMASELKKPDYLGVPVNIAFMSGGSNHEPAAYTAAKPAEGYQLMHMSGSFPGYFNLPHFTVSYDDFQIVARVEKTLYAVAVRCDDPDIKSWNDLVAFAKKKPGELSMGSNKVGSVHHVHHTRIGLDPKGAEMRFVPYQGTGGVVKDVVGGHLRVGFAQPGLWNSHIEAGTICPLLLLNETKLDHPLWTNVPSIRDAGMTYEIPHQWQGFLVKKGTPEAVMDKLAASIKKATESETYKQFMKNQPHSIVDFDSDRAKLSEKFYQDIKDVRAFMIANGLIPG